MAKSKVTKASKPIQEPEIKEKKKYNYTVKTGRPTEYTTELAIEFCNRLIRSASVAEVCRADDMPDRSTIFLWKLQNKGGDFLDLYEQAQKVRLEGWADDIVDIGDNPKPLWAKNDKGEDYIFTYEDVNRSKLRVDSRKWLLAKLNSKVFGDKVGEDENKGNKPITVNIYKGDNPDIEVVNE